MWIWLRYAAIGSGAPTAAERQFLYDQLGINDAHRYLRLADEFPKIKKGPDQDVLDHYSKLKAAKQESLKGVENLSDADKAVQDRYRLVEPNAEASPLRKLPESRPAPRGPRLPARDPGWYTSPASSVDTRYGVPPETLPQREPGATIPNHGQPGAGYAPDPQSMLDWVNWLRGKGISVNHALQVPNAARPEDMPTYRPHGRDLVEEFSRPANPEPAVPEPDEIDNRLLLNQRDRTGLGTSLMDRARGLFGSRKASAIVTSYIEGVLVQAGEKLPKVASLEDKMGELGWSYHRSGSGNWFQHPNIGGNVHILEHQPDGGWIHNYGPTEDEMGEHPIGYPSLKEALLHIHGDGQHGHIQVPYKPRPQLPTSRMN